MANSNLHYQLSHLSLLNLHMLIPMFLLVFPYQFYFLHYALFWYVNSSFLLSQRIFHNLHMDKYMFYRFQEQFFSNAFFFCYAFLLENKCYLHYQLSFISTLLKLFVALTKVVFLLIFPLLPLTIFIGVVFTLICGKIYGAKSRFMELMCYSKSL